jgi:hypothetical protein
LFIAPSGVASVIQCWQRAWALHLKEWEADSPLFSQAAFGGGVARGSIVARSDEVEPFKVAK